MAEPNNVYEQLEPIASVVPLGGFSAFDTAARLSAAISLKRIADIMEKVVGDGAQLDPHFLHDAAYVAGQAFERGRR